MEILLRNLSVTHWTKICDFTDQLDNGTRAVESCFNASALAWPPTVFLMLGVVYHCYYSLATRTKRRCSLEWTWLLRCKLGVNFILLLCSSAIAGLHVARYTSGFTDIYSMLSLVLLCVCVLILLVLTELNRRLGRITSGTVHVAWFLLVVCESLGFSISVLYTLSESQIHYQLVRYQNYIHIVSYPLMIVELILHSFADRRTRQQTASPEENCSFLSQITFSWVISLVIRCYRQSLWRCDLWPLPSKLASSCVVPHWEKHWQAAIVAHRNKTVSSENCVDESSECPSLILALVSTFKWQFLPAMLMKLVGDILIFTCPLILKALLIFIDDSEIPLWIGLAFAFLLFICSSINCVLGAQAEFRMNKIGMNVRTALCSTVYKKALRLSAASRQKSSLGEMVDLMAVDAQCMSDVTEWMYQIWSAPLVVAIDLYLLHNELGWSGLVGVFVMLALSPVNFALSRLEHKRARKSMMVKDRRMVLMNEVLNGMKEFFEQKVTKIRSDEIRLLKQGSYFDAINGVIFSCAPFLIALTSFASFALSSPTHILTAERLFVSLSLFYMLRPVINRIPQIISSVVQSSVSHRRVRQFLAAPELNREQPIPLESAEFESTSKSDHPMLLLFNNSFRSITDGVAVRLQHATFAWNLCDPKPTLEDIDLSIEPGQLIAIVGSVGSGKSSLLSAILGEMETRAGVTYVRDTIAYVPQQAWIQSATVRANITFQREYSRGDYDRTIDACALRPDFALLSDGDMTEIGEKGITLSGGQKQRVSLARAIYQNRDIYLFDDPLSAVDAHVGRHIFENVLGHDGLLKNKTRVLVTHSLTYLKHMDQIIVMKNGCISDRGTLAELLQRRGACAEFLDTFMTDKSSVEKKKMMNQEQNGDRRAEQPSTNRNCREESPKADVTGQNVKYEEIRMGNVNWSVYKTYASAIGHIRLAIIFVAFALSSSMGFGMNVWLSEWSQDHIRLLNRSTTVQVQIRLAVYGAIGIAQGFFIFCTIFLTSRYLISASARLHQRMLKSLLRSPMSFFDTTPHAVIMNRIGKDVDAMDHALPSNVRMLLDAVLRVLTAVIVMSIATPWVLAVVIPLTAVYFIFRRFSISATRQLRRLELASRAPIYSHFGETLAGVSSIRAFGAEKRFIDELHFRIDEHMRTVYARHSVSAWIAVTLDLMGNVLILSTALLAVLMRDNSNSGWVGLSITYAMSVTQGLMTSVISSSNLESNIVSVERITDYIALPAEAPWITEVRPPPDWPSRGTIHFEGVQLRYRPDLDLILENLDWTVGACAKVGIVGRTGAGKSSTALAIFRIVEPCGGRILIDGIDIGRIGLHDLRSRLAIIPQDPVLFSGSLRSNLDPFDQYEDAQIWQALEDAHLKPFVSQFHETLQFQIAEGGDNLSVGQRQLICLARALIRQCRILVLDEATASVDAETESRILDTIHTKLSHCTIITIAHRLDTILDNDKVLVMSRGRALENGSPQSLLQDRQSAFFSMAVDAGSSRQLA